MKTVIYKLADRVDPIRMWRLEVSRASARAVMSSCGRDRDPNDRQQLMLHQTSRRRRRSGAAVIASAVCKSSSLCF